MNNKLTVHRRTTMRHFLYIFLLTFIGVRGDYKRWRWSTNWEEGSNWSTGKAPCAKDTIHLPSQAPAIYVQTNTTITEIILPMNGELILGKHVSLGASLPSQNDPSCPGQDVFYTRNDSRSWLDGDNWCTSADAEGECRASQPDLLDAEAVPCSYDGVSFPGGRVFLVNLHSHVDITVGALYFDDKHQTTGTFRTFLSSKEGQQQFKRDAGTPTTVTVRASVGCSDATGCACGNDQGPIFDAICEKKKLKCPALQCDKPIQATGSCCQSCGGLLKMSYDHSSFHYTNFKNKIYNRFLHDETLVKGKFSKTSTGNIQLLLTDDGEGHQAATVAQKVYNNVQKDMQGDKEYGITKVDLQSSENEPATPEPVGPTHSAVSGKMSGSSVTGIVFAIIILVCLLALALFCLLYRRQRKEPLDIRKSVQDTWSRMAQRMRSQDLEEGRVQDKVVFGDLASFENPMFGQPGAETYQEMQERDVHPADPAVSGLTYPEPGFSNPLYGQSGMVEEIVHNNGVKSSILKLNPAFTDEGVEDDSTI